jgi:hypothetical protein
VSAWTPRLAAAFEQEMTMARQQLRGGDARTAFVALERAHALGQRRFVPHWRVHLAMLHAAWQLRDGRELRGQVLRLALVPLGHALGRLPLGNTGGANVSAFAPMPVAPDLRRLLDGADR